MTGTKGDAMRIEAFIKSLHRSEKIKLVADPETLKTLVIRHFPQIEVTVSDISVESDSMI